MLLLDRILEDRNQAMKDKDSAKLSTLRMLYADLKNKQIEKGDELSDDDVMATIKSSVKKLKDSITEFEKAGREDLTASASAEVVVLEEYLPEQMSDEQLRAIAQEVVEQTGASSKADFGKVMGPLMAKVAGRADGGRVKQVLETILA
ncbi:GatB/YqeY domain-containing protein [Candidatus Nomurabacteria bacterium]|nr:GatB/YqeY domain-containing protein [Candidatus Nomurabacteria bacterium]